MGGDSFTTASWGKTAEEAFQSAVKQAEYDHGHAGYTGTIAEKDEFVMIQLPEHKDPIDLADELIRDDERVGDKWGPCGCIEIPKDLYDRVTKECYMENKAKADDKLFLFFGNASS